jgi:hypothetical protein
VTINPADYRTAGIRATGNGRECRIGSRTGLAVLLLIAFRAATAADRILEQIDVLPDARGSMVRIELNTPVAVISHTPPRNSDLLQIQIRPVFVGGSAEIRDLTDDGSSRLSLADRNRGHGLQTMRGVRPPCHWLK